MTPKLRITLLTELTTPFGMELRRAAITDSRALAVAEQVGPGTSEPFLATATDSAIVAAYRDWHPLDGPQSPMRTRFNSGIGDVVGYIVHRPWPEEMCLFLGMVWVHPFARRQGIYRTMLRMAELRARSLGFTSMRAGIAYENRASAATHGALGFRPLLIERRLCR